MAIKPKLQSLLASANEVTGEERTNLTDAVQDLVDGYGQGGSEFACSTPIKTGNVHFFNSTPVKLDLVIFSNNPADYTKVDWVESRNDAFIVVDVKRNGQDVSCEAEFEVVDRTGIAVIFGFGDDGANQGGGCFVGINATNWALLEPGVNYNTFGTNALGTYTATLSLSGNTATVSGDLSQTKSSSNWSTSASYNNKPSLLARSYTAPIRIKKAKYIKAGNLDSQVYSCYHTDTEYLGVFDSVKNRFYMGIGDFVKPTDTSNEINLATYLNNLGGN